MSDCTFNDNCEQCKSEEKMVKAMTQIDEPIFKQVDGILNELIHVACDYEQGKDVDLDSKANETNHALQALIATKIQEARIDELRAIVLPEQYKDYAMIRGYDACAICGFNAIKFGEFVEDRIAQLRGKE